MRVVALVSGGKDSCYSMMKCVEHGHTIVALKYDKSDDQGIDSAVSQIFFVDLAGRENERTTLATGERLVELSFINKSLFHLSNCINALGAGDGGAAGNHKKMPRARVPGC